MVSKITIIGAPIFVIGLLMFILFTFLGILIIPPFIVSSPQLTDTVTVPAGTTRTVSLMNGNIGAHPLPLIAKGIFIVESDNGYDATITLMHISELGELSTGVVVNYVDPAGSLQKSLQVTLAGQGTSVPFTLSLNVDNTGSNEIRIRTRVVQVTFMLFATFIPIIIALIGFLLIIVGLIAGRGKKAAAAKRPKAVPGGWEPTLQWGGGSGTSSTAKQPKMAIKSSKAPKKGKKKVVRKVAAPGGGQQGCKFCGKQVATSAFFCPHCYGKLR
ncbi:MAG: hypothetical protein ACXAC8_04335 [Candidatus Hodarchaeales archaeon]|jgi:hypothetical protein